MIDFLKTRWRVLLLRRSDRLLRKAYSKDRKDAVNNKKGHAFIEQLDAQENFERSIYIDEIIQIETRKLCRQAARYGVLVSWENPDFWESSRVIGGRQLTDKGFYELRSAIRKEKNERWAYWELRLKVLGGFATAITGAAGALIGLFAIWKK
jgi:hypothetical protein